MYLCPPPVSHVILKLYLPRFSQIHPSFQPKTRVPPPQHPPHLSPCFQTGPHQLFLLCLHCFFKKLQSDYKGQVSPSSSSFSTFPSHTCARPPKLLSPSCFYAMQVPLCFCRTYFPHLLCLIIPCYELHVCVPSKFIC